MGYILPTNLNFESSPRKHRLLQNLYTVEQTTFELQITDIGLTNLGDLVCVWYWIISLGFFFSGFFYVLLHVHISDYFLP